MGRSYTLAINDAGAIAFLAQMDNFQWGIFAVDAGVVTTVVDSMGPLRYFERPSINSNGTIAFLAYFDQAVGYGRAIYMSSLGVTDLIVDSAGGDCTDLCNMGRPAINDQDAMVFFARPPVPPDPPPTRAVGIYYRAGEGSAPQWLVGRYGQDLFGSPLEKVAQPRINNGGQIVFSYKLINAISGLAVAMPAVEPE